MRRRTGINAGLIVHAIRNEDSESREDDLGREVLEREQAGVAQRMSATEPQHQTEDDVIQQHEDGRGRKAGDCEAELVVPIRPSGAEDVSAD